MNFREAFIECLKGERIRRTDWPQSNYLMLRFGKFRIFNGNSKNPVNLNDLLDIEHHEDWEIYEGETYD